MTTSDFKESKDNKENGPGEDSVSSTTKGSTTTTTAASAKKQSGRPDFVYDLRDRESFYKDLQTFHENRSTPIVRFPKVNGKEVDLHQLYAEVVKRGGWLKVNIRNEWDELLHLLGVDQKCVNASVALKHIYTRYLDKYERLHFLGEDPDRVDEPDDESSRHKKWSTKTVPTVPMTYNHSQHQLTEQLRVMHKLSTDIYKPSEYDKLILSLMSALPNEQDFAINVCTLMANEGQHTLKLDHCPKLVDVLIAHCGVFGHFSMRDIFIEMYTKIRKHSLQTFWTDCLYDKPSILELSYEDYSQAPDEKFADMAAYQLDDNLRFISPGANIDPEVFKEDVGKYDFLCLGRGLGTHDYVGQRVQQVASIMRNLSFFEENLPALSTNRTFIRFLVMLANVRWGNLHHMALDIFGNIATQVSLLDASSDDLTRAIFTTLCEGLEGQDRGVIISSLEILNKLSQKDTNRKSLTKHLEFKTYNQICLFLALNDIMLLLYTLECLYGLSSLGSRPCNFIIQVKGIVDTLVSLITVEAQSYGPDGCILMRVVETVPGNMLPMVAQNIANLQNVAMQGHVLTVKKEAHEAALAAAAESQKAIIAAQGGTPVRGIPQNKDNTSTPQTPTKTVSVGQENDPFAIAWMTATFESVASPGSRVEQQELYKMYLVACQKAGRRGNVSPIHFPQIVRTVLGPNVGPNLIKTTEPNGAELNAFYYINIRMRANPMPVQYKPPTMQIQQQPVVNQSPVVGSPGQKIVTKTQTTQSPAVQQQSQVKIVQQQTATTTDASVVATPNKKPEVGQKGKAAPKKVVGGQLPAVQQSPVVQQTPAQLPTNQAIRQQQLPQQQQQQQIQVQQQPQQQSMANVQQTVPNHPQAPPPTPAIQQQQHVHHQPQIVTQLQENQLVAGKHVIISHSVASQQVLAKPHLNPDSNPAIAQHPQQQQHAQPQPQQMQIQQQPQMQVQKQHIQIQQQPQPMQLGQPPAQQQQQQHVSHQTSHVQIQSQQQQQQIVINPNGSTTLIQGNANMSQTSLIKSLLANKVTTSPSATSDVIEANASAAPNNPSCLITQNVNLHQVAQRQQLKQQQQAQQQQQQQQNATHAAITSLVNNAVISANAVKVGQTTIKPITSNAVLPASVIEKKPAQIIQPPQSSVDSTDNVSSNWDPVPPLAPLSGNLQNIKIHSNVLITPSNDDSNSTGNNSVASSAISSNQVATTDDGEGSLMSFEGLLIPKSKSEASTEDEASKDSFNRPQVQGNQMLVDLLDKKSPEPPAMVMGSGIKRKYEDDQLADSNKRLAGGGLTDDASGQEERPLMQASKNAAKLFEEMAASILEDEDLEDESELEQSIPIIPPPVEQKQVITMPMPIQRQIIMGPNNQVILTQPGQPMNQPVQPQATATIKTESGLQTVPLIIQKQIGPNGQSIIQPVIHQQQPTQTQYMLATNPQGQTYLVAQQTGQQQTLNPALLLAQTGQQQGTQTKTIIILQQQGGPPQAVAQQQIISNPGGQQKVIMTTQQGQQMIVTQVPRPVQHHQFIVSNQNPNIMQTGPGQNVILSPNGSIVQQTQIPQQIQIQGHPQQLQIQQAPVGQQQVQIPQQQIQIHPVQQQQIQIQSAPHSVIQKQMHISQVGSTSIQVAPSMTLQPQSQATIQIQTSQPQSTIQSQVMQQQPQPSILSQLPQIPATIKIHPSSAQLMQTPPKMTPTKAQIVLQQQANIPTQTMPQQQSVIQATPQSQQQQQQQRAASEVKRQLIVTGSGTIEMSETAKRIVPPSVNQAAPSQQSAAQVPVTPQKPQPPVQAPQQPAPQIPPQQAAPQPTPQQQQPQPPPQSPQTPAAVVKKPPPITEEIDEEFDHNWPWICDWRGCPRKEYKSLADVYRHACLVHCPEGLDPAAEIYCQWGPGSGLCDNIPRKRYSLMTHLLDRHCTLESFKAAIQRRISTGVLPPVHGQPVTIVKNVTSNSSESRGTASPSPSTSSSGSLPPAASAAMHAIKRHSNDFVNPKELMDENEGPVTKSIRLTAALILRNLVTHTSLAKRNLRCYEPHLAGVALSNVESSRTISQILYELNN